MNLAAGSEPWIGPAQPPPVALSSSSSLLIGRASARGLALRLLGSASLAPLCSLTRTGGGRGGGGGVMQLLERSMEEEKDGRRSRNPNGKFSRTFLGSSLLSIWLMCSQNRCSTRPVLLVYHQLEPEPSWFRSCWALLLCLQEEEEAQHRRSSLFTLDQRTLLRLRALFWPEFYGLDAGITPLGFCLLSLTEVFLVIWISWKSGRWFRNSENRIKL